MEKNDIIRKYLDEQTSINNYKQTKLNDDILKFIKSFIKIFGLITVSGLAGFGYFSLIAYNNIITIPMMIWIYIVTGVITLFLSFSFNWEE